MLKASSLFYAIAIALIIALVSSSLILFAYFNRLHINSNLLKERIQRNARSGLTLLLSDQSPVNLNEKKTFDLFDSGSDSMTLEKKSWGLFEIAVSSAFAGDKKTTQIAQLGSVLEDQQMALYLADEDKPLSVCGKTIIKGAAYLPKAGVRRAYIEGQSFSENKLIDGQVKESQRNVPQLNKELLARISQIFNHDPSAPSDPLIEELKAKDTVNNSFERSTIYLLDNNAILLNNKYYNGNIAVVSKKSIKVGADSHLKDILLIAPRIEIEENFTGNIQAFASDSLIVSKKCTLNYPSVVGIVNASQNISPGLIIKEDVIIEGAILAVHKDQTEPSKMTNVSMDKNSMLKGQLYTNGSVDMKGTVHGSVLCTRFVLHTPSSVYENHLLNAVIDNSQLSPYFVGIQLTEKESVKKIVKWLY